MQFSALKKSQGAGKDETHEKNKGENDFGHRKTIANPYLSDDPDEGMNNNHVHCHQDFADSSADKTGRRWNENGRPASCRTGERVILTTLVSNMQTLIVCPTL
jgi:hypothetical protein